MKKTAVEWLREKLWKEFNFSFSDNILEQAKEMEKEQMKYFIQVGYYANSQGHTKDDELYNYWIDNYKK
jgi:hypothetical protein